MSHFSEPFQSGAGSFQEWFRIHGTDSAQSLQIAPGPQKARTASDAIAPAGSVAAIVHAYYPELLPEIRDLLAGYTGVLKLFVTTTPDKVAAVGAALEGFADPFKLLAFENRGRDVRPFLHLLPEVFAEQHDFILKLHTENGIISAMAIYGEENSWRAWLILRN